jgi:Single-strand binding protein family
MLHDSARSNPEPPNLTSLGQRLPGALRPPPRPTGQPALRPDRACPSAPQQPPAPAPFPGRALGHDVAADGDTLVTDEHVRPGDQVLHPVLGLPAERAPHRAVHELRRCDPTPSAHRSNPFVHTTPADHSRHPWSHVARRPDSTIPTSVPPVLPAIGHPAPHHDQWPDRGRFDPSRSVLGARAESFSKGNRAVVLGRLRTRSWETPEGDKRSVTEIDADEVARSRNGERSAERGQFDDPPPF